VNRYECVADQKAAGFPVTAACAAVDVSTSVRPITGNSPGLITEIPQL
jgi:hypothetical protein